MTSSRSEHGRRGRRCLSARVRPAFMIMPIRSGAGATCYSRFRHTRRRADPPRRPGTGELRDPHLDQAPRCRALPWPAGAGWLRTTAWTAGPEAHFRRHLERHPRRPTGTDGTGSIGAVGHPALATGTTLPASPARPRRPAGRRAYPFLRRSSPPDPCFSPATGCTLVPRPGARAPGSRIRTRHRPCRPTGTRNGVAPGGHSGATSATASHLGSVAGSMGAA